MGNHPRLFYAAGELEAAARRSAPVSRRYAARSADSISVTHTLIAKRRWEKFE